MANEILINQSLIKDLLKYENEELCGLVFTHKWIFKNFGKTSLAKNLGHYFEFLATGSLPKSGDVPEKEETKPYLIVEKQVEYLKYLFTQKSINIIQKGYDIEIDKKWIGTLDIVAEWEDAFKLEDVYLDPKNKSFQVIIDLKYSGLLDDKYSEFGWQEDSLQNNKKTLLQAIHYKFLYWKKFGINVPFFFFVFDSKKPKYAKIIHISISDNELEQHENFLKKAKAYFDNQNKLGFKPKPEYSRCISCEYEDMCMFKEDIPQVININF